MLKNTTPDHSKDLNLFQALWTEKVIIMGETDRKTKTKPGT